jgi:hypothetical protein
MFFSFFKKSPVESTEKDNSILASITYYVDKNSTGPVIDIALENYDEESINALCKLIDILGEDISYIETINMIKSALIADKQEDLLLKIFTHISQQSRNRILSAHKESIKDETCIKPSDMLK